MDRSSIPLFVIYRSRKEQDIILFTLKKNIENIVLKI